MKICKVVGNIWATKKEDSLRGVKLMVVQPKGGGENDEFVAADLAGAGIGEQVLVVTGSTARAAFAHKPVYIDATIVGIIDEAEHK